MFIGAYRRDTRRRKRLPPKSRHADPVLRYVTGDNASSITAEADTPWSASEPDTNLVARHASDKAIGALQRALCATDVGRMWRIFKAPPLIGTQSGVLRPSGRVKREPNLAESMLPPSLSRPTCVEVGGKIKEALWGGREVLRE